MSREWVDGYSDGSRSILACNWYDVAALFAWHVLYLIYFDCDLLQNGWCNNNSINIHAANITYT